MSSSAAAKEQLKEVMKAKVAAGKEKSLGRKIVESGLYDWNPTARFLLNQIAVMRMDEDSNYPDDAPSKYKADKVDWCWLSQHGLALRMGVSESTVHRLIKRFRKDGVIFYRDWTDDYGTPHAEYKINEEVLDAFQRPSQDRGVERPPRYKVKRGANKGSFSATNQPSHRDGSENEDDA